VVNITKTHLELDCTYKDTLHDDKNKHYFKEFTWGHMPLRAKITFPWGTQKMITCFYWHVPSSPTILWLRWLACTCRRRWHVSRLATPSRAGSIWFPWLCSQRMRSRCYFKEMSVLSHDCAVDRVLPLGHFFRHDVKCAILKKKKETRNKKVTSS
jgi:hypothetical protein